MSLKQRIHNKEPIKIAGGVPFGCTRDEMEAVLSQDDYDLIGTDHQHAAADEDKLVEYCKMADEVGVGVQLRIKHTRHAYLIGNLLDLGPLAIVVPQVETVETVDEAIDAFYYLHRWENGVGDPAILMASIAAWIASNTPIGGTTPVSSSYRLSLLNAVINVRKFAKAGCGYGNLRRERPEF